MRCSSQGASSTTHERSGASPPSAVGSASRPSARKPGASAASCSVASTARRSEGARRAPRYSSGSSRSSRR
eukprot:scaffold10936_cov33-Phaeocystis_antarctica.AAC.1